jgi:hypothetical protein
MALIITAGCGELAVTPDSGAPDAAPDEGPLRDGGFDVADEATDATDDYIADASSVQVLTSNAGQAQSLAVDTTTIYWSTQGGAISSCAKTNCVEPFATIAYSQQGANYLTLDSGYLYWATTDGNIARCNSNTNCADGPTVLQPVQYGTSALVLAHGVAYWNTFHAIVACTLSDCSTTTHTVVGGGIQPVSVVVDDTNVYWSDVGSGGTSGAKVLGCSLVGCGSPVTIAENVDGAGTIIQDATSLYWRSQLGSTSELVTCPKTGCIGQPVSVGSSPPIVGLPLLLDGTNAYWSTTLGLVRCDALSCPTGADVITAPQSPWAMAVDATSLYWTDATNGTISRLTPK